MPTIAHTTSRLDTAAPHRVTACACPSARARIDRVVRFYEALTPAALAGLAAVYQDDVRFSDPFIDVTGLPALRRIFEHMYATLDEPRFAVLESIAQDERAVLLWDFHFRRGARRTVTIHGASHLAFGTDGRVAVHRDYRDAARQVYEQVPELGPCCGCYAAASLPDPGGSAGCLIRTPAGFPLAFV